MKTRNGERKPSMKARQEQVLRFSASAMTTGQWPPFPDERLRDHGVAGLDREPWEEVGAAGNFARTGIYGGSGREIREAARKRMPRRDEFGGWAIAVHGAEPACGKRWPDGRAARNSARYLQQAPAATQRGLGR